MEEKTELMSVDNLCGRVYVIRGQQVMLDYDLAEIYGYEVKALNQQVKRNIAKACNLERLQAFLCTNLKIQLLLHIQ